MSVEPLVSGTLLKLGQILHTYLVTMAAFVTIAVTC